METTKIIKLKPGEAVTMIAATEEITEAHNEPTVESIESETRTTTETTESKPKKKRNTKKEAAWAREKYAKFTFSIDKNDGEILTRILETKDIKLIDWFRTMVRELIENPNAFIFPEHYFKYEAKHKTSETPKPEQSKSSIIIHEDAPFKNQITIDESFPEPEPTKPAGKSTRNTPIVSKPTTGVSESEANTTEVSKPTTGVSESEAKKWKEEHDTGISWRQMAKNHRRDWRTIKKAVENLK